MRAASETFNQNANANCNAHAHDQCNLNACVDDVDAVLISPWSRHHLIWCIFSRHPPGITLDSRNGTFQLHANSTVSGVALLHRTPCFIDMYNRKS